MTKGSPHRVCGLKFYRVNGCIGLVPEAVAFAFVAHAHPLVGLCGLYRWFDHRAIWWTSGNDFGATGALAVVMVAWSLNMAWNICSSPSF